MNLAATNIKSFFFNIIAAFKKLFFSNSFWCYVSIALIFLSSGYLIIFTVLPTFFLALLYLLFFLFCVSFYIIKRKTLVNNIRCFYRQNIMSIFFVAVFCICCVLSFFVNKEFANINYYGQTILLVLNGVLFVNIFSFEFFYKRLSNLFFIICALSLIIFVLYRISGLINFSPFGYVHNSNNIEFANFIISFIGGKNRLQGPFWEPGLFSSFVLIVSIFDIIYFKKVNLVKIIVYFTCVIFSFSTFAYICLPILIVMTIKYRIKNKKIKNIFFGALILLALVSIIFYKQLFHFLASVLPSVFGKLDGLYNSVSFTTRLYSPYVNLLVFIKNPFVGKGLYGADLLYSEMIHSDFKTIVDSQTSTTFRFMAQLGVGGFLYTLFIVLSFVLNKEKDFIDMLLISVLFLLIVNKEPHNQIMFTLIIPFYMAKSCFNKDKEVCLIYDH